MAFDYYLTNDNQFNIENINTHQRFSFDHLFPGVDYEDYKNTVYYSINVNDLPGEKRGERYDKELGIYTISFEQDPLSFVLKFHELKTGEPFFSKSFEFTLDTDEEEVYSKIGNFVVNLCGLKELPKD